MPNSPGRAAHAALAAGLALLLLPFAGRSDDAAPAALTLEEALAASLARNETAAAAAERVRAAEARVAQARSLFLPDLSVVGTWGRDTADAEPDLGRGGLAGAPDAVGATATATLPIFDARSFPLHRRARLGRDSARLQADDVRQLLAYEVAVAYVAALSAEQVQAAAERRVQLARTTLEDARDRARAGLVGTNDVTRAELELASAERERALAQAGVETARLGLGYLMDGPADRPLEPPRALLAAAESAGEDASAAAEARERRLDVRALRLEAEALRAFAREPALRLVPRLALTGQYRTASPDGFDDLRDGGFVGLTLTWSVWDGGLREAERRERLALAAISSLDARAAERATDRDVRSAQSALRAGRVAAVQAGHAADAARRNARESAILYRQGLTTALAVADANLRLFEAEIGLVRAGYEVAEAFLDLRRASGLDPLGREQP